MRAVLARGRPPEVFPRRGDLRPLPGRLTLYESRGKFQMSVVEMEPTGAGALALAFEQLKKRLRAEGLFDPARKRPLPFLPRRLGVVTSPTGAVLRDIIRVAHRRFPDPHPARADAGAGGRRRPGHRRGAAPPRRRRRRRRHHRGARRRLARGPVGVQRRGGRPRHRRCRVPVISAVGHETDFTIADFVADLRAPTPSAAAELAVPSTRTSRPSWRFLGRRSGRATAEKLRSARHVLERRGRASAIRVGSSTSGGNGSTNRRSVDVGFSPPVWPPPGRPYAPPRSASIDAPPQRRIGEQRAVLASLRHRLEGAIRPRARSTPARHRGGLRQARRALARPGARARLQPDPERRGSPGHQRRRPTPRRTRSRSLAGGAPSTRRCDEVKHRNDPRRRPGRRRQQEPLARHPQRRVPGPGRGRPVRGVFRRRAPASARW